MIKLSTVKNIVFTVFTICMLSFYIHVANADNVIAIVEGDKIYESDFKAVYNQLPQEIRADKIENLYPHLLERIIQQRLIIKIGRDSGLKNNQNIIERLRIFEDQLIFESYLANIADSKITQDDIRKEYDIYITKLPEQEEVKVSHILLDSEEEARKIINRIGAGENFAMLAKQYSNGPSREFGGDLGYFIKGRMVAEFEHVAFALEANRYSVDPVKTQYGWHIILVKDKRIAAKPTYKKMAPIIRNKMREALAAGIASDIVNSANIKRFDMNGRPMAAPANLPPQLQ